MKKIATDPGIIALVTFIIVLGIVVLNLPEIDRYETLTEKEAGTYEKIR